MAYFTLLVLLLCLQALHLEGFISPLMRPCARRRLVQLGEAGPQVVIEENCGSCYYPSDTQSPALRNPPVERPNRPRRQRLQGQQQEQASKQRVQYPAAACRQTSRKLLPTGGEDHDHYLLCISTFNILAPCYKRLPPTPSEFFWPSPPPRESELPQLWKDRAWDIANFIKRELIDSEIICLQEYWSDHEYQSLFQEILGPTYDFYFYQRPNSKADGVAVLLKRDSLFQVKASQGYQFDTTGSRVAQILHLVERNPGPESREVLLLNTHLTFPHHAMDRASQMAQVMAVNRLLQEWPHPLPPGSLHIVTGDFNVERGDPVCSYLTQRGFCDTFGAVEPGRFVSHCNHLKEEVGVDHVFTREVKDDEKPGGRRRYREGEKEEEGAWVTPVVSLVDDNNSHRGREEEEEEEEKEETPAVQVLEAFVVPRDLPSERWDRSFDISDHRPVTVVLRVRRKESTTPPTTAAALVVA